MSEYWKSTPKYWCKFCKTFVRDTGLERKAHDSTPKHQSNIQRSLRDLHKNTEREEREKQRAKDEVARLNGIVSGRSGSAKAGPSGGYGAAGGTAKATPEERKRQMEQLAAMGIAVPQEFRKDLAVGGEWSTVSETPIYNVKPEDEEGKPTGSFGVRKRKLDEDEEEALAVEKKGWGSRFKTYPGSKGADDDLDALLTAPIIKKEHVKQDETPSLAEPETNTEALQAAEPESKEVAPLLKKEESIAEPPLAAIPDVDQPIAPVKHEEAAAADPPIVFKKRKGKR